MGKAGSPDCKYCHRCHRCLLQVARQTENTGAWYRAIWPRIACVELASWGGYMEPGGTFYRDNWGEIPELEFVLSLLKTLIYFVFKWPEPIIVTKPFWVPYPVIQWSVQGKVGTAILVRDDLKIKMVDFLNKFTCMHWRGIWVPCSRNN